jgi:hypothetical protein
VVLTQDTDAPRGRHRTLLQIDDELDLPRFKASPPNVSQHELRDEHLEAVKHPLAFFEVVRPHICLIGGRRKNSKKIAGMPFVKGMPA